MSKLLEVKNLCKYFDVSAGLLHAIDDVSFTVNSGETLGVVGESGCGKSTLGRTILRLHEPTSGQVLFDGIDITRLNNQEMRRIRQQMQIIFQDPYASLNPRLTVAEIIEEPLRINKVYSKKRDRQNRVVELMNLVGLTSRAYNAYPHEFDGGRRQRVVIARALSISPRFIVCDEPVSALDVSIQAQILNLLMELQEQMQLTYIFISHDLSVVKHISDQVAVMYLGSIVEKSSAKSLYKKQLHPYTRILLAAVPSFDILAKRKRILLKGEIKSPINPDQCCRFVSRCPFATCECREAIPPLVEVESGHYSACFRSEEMRTGSLNFERL